MSNTCVWTRSLADWGEDELLLANGPLGTQASILHYPCIELSPLNPRQPNAPLWERHVFTHAVLTSANAVHFAWKEPVLHQILKRVELIYTHGKSTAAALQDLNLPVQLLDSARTAEELTRAVALRLPNNAIVALPGAEKPAYDMQTALQSQKVNAVHIACYRTVASMHKANGQELSRHDIARLQKELAGLVCFASPSAVEAFVSALAPAKTRLKTALTAVAIGPSTAKACESHFERIVTADNNQVSGLVRAAERLLLRAT